MGQIPMDNLSLSFTVEEWLNSETAEVTIDIDASLDAAGLDLKKMVNESLAELIPDVTWRYSRVSRNRDRTGRETWQLGAQARVTDEALEGLSIRAKTLSEAGLQFRVGRVDYTPTAEAVEESNRSLRLKINSLVAGELLNLNNELSGRHWRVANIMYTEDMSTSNSRMGSQRQVLMASAVVASTTRYNDENDFEAGDEESGAGSGGFEISQKMEITASVTFSSIVVNPLNTTMFVGDSE